MHLSDWRRLGITLLSAFVICIVILRTADASFGSVPDWVEASATVVAAAAAIAAGRWALDILEIEQRRDHSFDEDRRRSHAEQIAVWIDPARQLQLGNASSQPVIDVSVKIYMYGSRYPIEMPYVLAPNHR